MKKTMIILIAIAISTFTFGQNEKYVSMMKKSITQMEAAKTMEDLQKVANVFERIANAEKKEWLASYYNSLCNVNLASLAMRDGKTDQIETFSDKAQAALDLCKTLEPNNSEVLALQGYIYTSRIWANPMTAGGKYSPMAHEAFGKAIAIDKNNPRAFYLRAQLVFYTPAFWGGGAKNAYKDLVEADKLFKAFKQASSIHPTWGEGGNTYHLEKAKEAVEG